MALHFLLQSCAISSLTAITLLGDIRINSKKTNGVYGINLQKKIYEIQKIKYYPKG